MSIFHRLLLSFILLFTICVSAIAYLLIDEAKDRIEDMRLRQVQTMVKSLGEGSINALIVKDYELLEGWVKASNAIDDFAYAALSKPDGLILSHTNPAFVALKHQSLSFDKGQELVIKELTYMKRPVREVVYAIRLGNKHIANAYLAYYIDTKFIYSAELISRLVELLLFALAFLSIISLYILRWGLKPIESLADVMQRITRNKDFSLRAEKTRDDEIGLLVQSFNDMLDQIQKRDQELEEEKNHVKESAEEVFITNKELGKEISERIEVERKLRELSETLEQRVEDRTKKLEELNKVVAETSRLAGMAEVANGVIHNVGNVLNSINISSSVIRDGVQHSSVDGVSKLSDLLEENKADLGNYISTNEKGKQIPEYIKLLSNQLLEEKNGLFNELDSLDKNITHIKNIVSTQQSFSGRYGIVELVDLKELIDYALKISLGNVLSQEVEIIKDYADIPKLLLDKNKFMQVLINIISNAKHALFDSENELKTITIKVSVDDDKIIMQITDTGVGIAEADMAHIFEYGFTKKKNGHGFGLHNSANIMKELGGEMRATSKGEGMGACFTVTLPLVSEAGK